MTRPLKIDDSDRAIIRTQQIDGRRPCAEIAAELGLAPSTVQQRASRVIEWGLLKIGGATNFVNGTVEAKADGLVRVLVGRQQVSAGAGGDEVTAGQRITLVARPEKLTLSRPGDGPGAALTGDVQEMDYIGADTRYVVGLLTGEVLVARIQNLGSKGRGHEAYAVADQVKVSWAAEDARALTA